MSPLRRLARRLGYDLVPVRKAKALPAQLALALEAARIDMILDAGANVGQYARERRGWGYAGEILSFEPQPLAHAELCRHAAPDPGWTVAPPLALGATSGEVEIELSAESDMSSILPQSELLRRISPTSKIEGRERVTLERLDKAAVPYISPGQRLFLKIDTQGYESRVLDGAAGLMDRIQGVQLELSLVGCYEGEPDACAMIERMEALGFSVHLIFPGYFERKLARQLQVDVVFMRDDAAGP
jgi:FkbM family methyltransferase